MLTIDHVEDVPEAAINDAVTLVRQIVAEINPELDMSDTSILFQALGYPNAVLGAAAREELELLIRSGSLKDILADPAAADPDAVDRVLSNFNIRRRQAGNVTGKLAIVQATNTGRIINTGMTFTTADNRVFRPVSRVIAVSDAVQAAETGYTQIRARSGSASSSYYFVVDVVETTAGGAGISQGTVFSTSLASGSTDDPYAIEDFPAASENESNEELVARLPYGPAVRTGADRVSITALARTVVTTTEDVAVIGCGDPEMRRNSHNLLGLPTGGMVDVYLRNVGAPAVKKLTVRGVPVAADASGVTLDLSVPADPDGGVILWVEAVRVVAPAETMAVDGTAVTFVEQRRLTGDGDFDVTPYIGSSAESVFSSRQGAITLRLTDKLTATQYLALITANLEAGSALILADGRAVSVDTILSTYTNYMEGNRYGLGYEMSRYYDVYVAYAPGIAALQSALSSSVSGAPAADYLVKSAIPCVVSAEMRVTYPTGSTPPDTSAILAAAVGAINAAKFTDGSLQASRIVAAVESALPTGARLVLPLSLRGTLVLPDLSQVALSGSDALTVPNYVSLGVSARNTAFYANSDTVSVTVVAR